MSDVTQTEIVKAEIEYNAQGASNKDITSSILKEWRNSQIVQDMKDADAYYKVQNTEIDKKTRNYQDEAGNWVQNTSLSNIKSKTAQYRKSVNQKVNFALAKPFIIRCDDDNYAKAWDDFLTDEIRAVIVRTGRSGINKGIGWCYPWINENGELEIVDVQSETMYPAWHDIAHTQLDFMVRDYSIVSYNKNMTAEDIHKVEFWDTQIYEKYIDMSDGEGEGALVPDTNGEFELGEGEEDRITIQKTHLRKKDGSGLSWNRVPFLFLKGCNDELPLLNECRSDIDNYDNVKSKSIDSIIDDIDAVIVIDGLGAEMGELTRARKIIQNSRIMTLDPGGKASVLKVDTDIQKIASELEIIKKDIQDHTSTVDLTTIQLGTNPSGKAMRTFYESLNEWANGFEAEFRVFMKNLKYFFDMWLSWKGGYGTFEELQDKKITFTLDRDMIIDETEIISNIVALDGKVSQETLDEMNPWVESHEKEEERREEDLKKAQEQMELYQFEQDIDQNNENDEDLDQNEEN